MPGLMRRPLVTGFLAALPIGTFAAWVADGLFAATMTWGGEVIASPIDMGPGRAAAFFGGVVVAAVLLSRRVAEQEIGPFGALLWFGLLAHLSAAAIAILVRLVTALDVSGGGVVGWFLAAVVAFVPAVVIWLPAGIAWPAIVRRVAGGLEPSTDVEVAEAEAALHLAMRAQERLDATQVGDQGARLRRGR